MGMDRERLVALVTELADNDELLHARLELDAARGAGSAEGPLRERLRSAVDDALVPNDYIDYHRAYDYVTTAHTMVETLAALIDDGHSDVAIDLTEHALTVLENGVGYIDDSDGHLRMLAEEIQDVHRAACAAAHLDPVVLAGRLFDLEVHAGDLDEFDGAAATYGDLLGDDGLKEYRRRASAAWAKVPALAPGSDREHRSRHFRLTRIMECLAELSGDVDAQVDVLARDLASSWQFARITTLLVENQRDADALSWAERGLEAYGASDHRLRELLYGLYHRLNRGEDAVALARRLHDEDPDPSSYRELATQARRAKTWKAEGGPAWDRLRGAVEKRRASQANRTRTRPMWEPAADSSDLVDVLIWEQRADEAWAEAQAGGCREALWVQLATLREKEHPADTIPIWQRQVERAADIKKNHGYQEAVDTLAHIAGLMKSAGDANAFGPYIADVRARHRAKRNLMALLAQRGW